MILRRDILLMLTVLLTGCAASQGFDRQTMRELFHHDPDVVTERDIHNTLELKPQTSMPYRLGLYFVRKNVPMKQSVKKADWHSVDKETLLRKLLPLRDEGVLTDVVMLAETTLQGTGLRDIRLAGARYGADAVLVVDGAAAVDRYNNGYAALYATLVGAYFAPGTESSALFMIEGSLWDVRSEFLYATQLVEGQSTSVGPAAMIEDRDVVAQAKAEALEEFGRRMENKLRLMKDDQDQARRTSR
ncbi:conserved exported protein of unknown function [Nitrospira sp. KM1]|uniref:hypothetical protein n=1 Tax=Nitrospira sp. KM1 TaxID=1936990 RepID=UPI0013A72C5A|nr:hypothetical protein [Nitrospira sp. KM1]BCA55126.1 conserved exported protein of unknown function [Nitrospira sp. KM1]